jgi:hypothetical protein
MRKLIPALALLVLTVSSAYAAYYESFVVSRLAWFATHVVVVSEGEKLDGEVTVLESWVGDIKRGSLLSLPGLKAFATKEARTEDQRYYPPKDRSVPTVVSGQRMVVFLVKTGDAWKPASRAGGTRVSVAWIEKGEAYAYFQNANPGPVILVRVHWKEQDMRERVEETAAARSRLRRVEKIEDPKERVRQAVPFVASDHYLTRDMALDVLANCGEVAVPRFREFLADPARTDYHALVIRKMGKLGTPSIGPDLVAIVQREHAFWRERGPKLTHGWWNGMGVPRKEVEPLRRHYLLAYNALLSLGKIRYPECREAVEEFREFWCSLGHLAVIDQMQGAANQVLAGLRDK